MTEVTADWFQYLKDKYGTEHPRLTEIKNFDTIEAAKVVEANEKLYINRQEGFIGTGMKKDEFVCNCSDLDDIIIFYKDGKYKVIRVAEKIFVGKNILHVAVFKKNDSRTIYNVVYRDGRVIYFTSNPNGEAEIIKITLDPTAKVKKFFLEKDFSEVIIKGRASKGNLLTKHPVNRISLKSHGHSTLGGRKVWYDPDVNRLNYDEHGRFLGEFNDEDQILVVLDNGDFYLSNFDLNNHYEDNILRLEKYQSDKVWTAILYDADQQGYPYLKRFLMEASKRKQNWLSENINSRLILLTDQAYPRIKVTFGGNDSFRDPQEIEAADFVGVKGFKARGKRLTTYAIASIEELEPTRFPEKPEEPEEEQPEQPESPEIPESPDSSEISENSEYSDNSEYSENSEPSDNSQDSLPPAPPKPAKKPSRKKDTAELDLFDSFEEE